MIRYLLFARILGIVVLSFTASFLMLKGFLFIPALFGFCILALSVFLYKDQQKTVKRMEYLIESIPSESGKPVLELRGSEPVLSFRFNDGRRKGFGLFYERCLGGFAESIV